MSSFVPIEGNAIVYCEGCFATPYGKTAHGLVRFTRRYQVVAVIDSTVSGNDAGEFLDGKSKNIPIVPDIASALETAHAAGFPATHLVLGIASDGGRLPVAARPHLIEAMQSGLNLDAGLHDFLSEDPELASVAQESGVTIRDVRRTPPRSELHSFTGKIEEVTSHVIAVLGTDSAVGKRTTAVELVRAFESAGTSAELVGTGQTSWMQGVRYQLLLDSLVSDFMAGEIEHAVWLAWHEQRPDVIVIEGQGSLMNPAYPGGNELMAAGRPHLIVLQHAPSRKEYDGFPGYPLHALPRQIAAIEMVSDRTVAAITVNHEGLKPEQVPAACAAITAETGLPAFDVLLDGADELAAALVARLNLRLHQ
jgi:uncharacterized NAD-dependent epimerase/dehydratase family protein